MVCTTRYPKVTGSGDIYFQYSIPESDRSWVEDSLLAADLYFCWYNDFNSIHFWADGRFDDEDGPMFICEIEGAVDGHAEFFIDDRSCLHMKFNQQKGDWDSWYRHGE